jgi:hypothetical protein
MACGLLERLAPHDGAEKIINRRNAHAHAILLVSTQWPARDVTGLALVIADQAFAAGDALISAPFAGPKANAGTVSFSHEGDERVLTLSSDFVSPDSPDTHWQVVDSSGDVYTLERLKVKEEREHRTITLPAYVRDVARVVIWCAFAETNLGEAAFEKPAK